MAKNKLIHKIISIVHKVSRGRKHTDHMLFTPKKSGMPLALDCKIPTLHGYKLLGDLVEGDVLFDEKGKKCRVKGIIENQTNRRIEVDSPSGLFLCYFTGIV